MKLSCLPVSFFDEILGGRLSVGEWAAMGAAVGLDAVDLSILFVPDRSPRALASMRREIDDAGTLELKKARYAANGIDARVTFIPGNYVALGVIPLLERSGFDLSLPSFFIWEGNTMYLRRPDVMKVLADLKESVRRFAISFDYMDEAVVAMTTGEAGATGFVERFANMGAPWTFGFDDLPALAGEARLAISDATTVGKLHRLYWPERPLESIIYDHYSLCTLKSPAA